MCDSGRHTRSIPEHAVRPKGHLPRVSSENHAISTGNGTMRNKVLDLYDLQLCVGGPFRKRACYVLVIKTAQKPPSLKSSLGLILDWATSPKKDRQDRPLATASTLGSCFLACSPHLPIVPVLATVSLRTPFTQTSMRLSLVVYYMYPRHLIHT